MKTIGRLTFISLSTVINALFYECMHLFPWSYFQFIKLTLVKQVESSYYILNEYIWTHVTLSSIFF